MIPLRLQLRNFMCHRELDSLDFSGIRLACLAGDNGHGKSALLDAITWALWGKARAKRDDELIHLGQTEMEVQFEFALGENHYRVIRRRDSRGRGQSSLELQVRDPKGILPAGSPWGDPLRGPTAPCAVRSFRRRTGLDPWKNLPPRSWRAMPSTRPIRPESKSWPRGAGS